jgi:quercetin dioxygenase-like cupin family protein
VTLNIYAHSTIDMQSIVHSGYELVFCLRGQPEYLIEKKIYQLETEDSLLFAEQLNHRWRNPDKTVMNVLLVL